MRVGNNFRVDLIVPATEMRRWHGAIAERLVAGTTIDPALVPAASAPAPAGIDLLFAFDRLISRHVFDAATDRLPSPRAASIAPDRGVADLVVDLTGNPPTVTDAPSMTVRCLGLPPLDGAVAALLDERAPVLEVVLHRPGSAPRTFGRWRAAVEDRRNTRAAVSQILGRLAHMVVAAVEVFAETGGATTLSTVEIDDRSNAPISAATRLLTRSLAARIAGRLDRLARTPADWHTIVRMRAPGTNLLSPESDPTPFRLVPDDGRRFYADPFVLRADGRTWLFVEEFPHATGKGILSVAEVDATGRPGTLRPFLEESCHLSWPQVFEEDGVVWMVPETSGRRTVELWRAVALPDRWERHAVLLADVDVGDATPVKTADGWWMFGTVRERWCSSWDALHVWHAPTLEGPWTAIGRMPVSVDAATARPAGRAIVTADGLLRPVQDSLAAYGAGLALMRVDRLATDGYAETRVKRFATPKPLCGLHTWNRAETGTGLFEAMDVFVAAADFGDERRLDLTPAGIGTSRTADPKT